MPSVERVQHMVTSSVGTPHHSIPHPGSRGANSTLESLVWSVRHRVSTGWRGPDTMGGSARSDSILMQIPHPLHLPHAPPCSCLGARRLPGSPVPLPGRARPRPLLDLGKRRQRGTGPQLGTPPSSIALCKVNPQLPGLGFSVRGNGGQLVRRGAIFCTRW